MYALTTDAQTAALNFVVNQSYTVNATAYATAFPDLDFGRLVYVDTSAPEFTPGVVTFLSSSVGRAEWYTAAAKDVPRADVTRDKNEVKIHMAAVGYGYDSEEIGTAQLIGQNLTADKALAARRAYTEFMWRVTLQGDADKGLQGLATSTNVTSGSVAANGTGTPNTLWFDGNGTQTKTAAQIVADINGGLTGVFTGSRTVEMADTIILPYTTIAQLASTPLTSTNSETILSFILRTNIYTQMTGQQLTIRGELGLETLGPGNTKLMVIYANRQDVVKLHLPMPHRFMPVWQDGPMSFQVPGAFRTGGVEVIRPGAFRYLYGF